MLPATQGGTAFISTYRLHTHTCWQSDAASRSGQSAPAAASPAALPVDTPSGTPVLALCSSSACCSRRCSSAARPSTWFYTQSYSGFLPYLTHECAPVYLPLNGMPCGRQQCSAPRRPARLKLCSALVQPQVNHLCDTCVSTHACLTLYSLFPARQQRTRHANFLSKEGSGCSLKWKC